MAITESIGYGGPVGEGNIPKWRQAFPGNYGVLGAGDWKAVIKTGLDRTVGIPSGVGYGKGVRDTNVGEVLVALDPLAAGSRWDLIVAHRDSSGIGGTTTFAKINGVAGGSSIAAFGTRKTFEVDGTQDDQPIALAQVTGNGGGGIISAIIDARVWVANGGAVARDEIVLQYLTEPGTTVRIGSNVWTVSLDASGATATRSKVSPVDMYGAGQSLDGGAAPASGEFKMQAGTIAGPSDQVGYVRIQFPKPFPNGLLSVVVIGGDDASGSDLNFSIAGGVWGTGNKDYAVYRVWGPDGAGGRKIMTGYNHRTNWIAVGW